MGDAEHAPQQPDAAAFPVERTARPREICSAPSAVHSVDEGGAHGRAGDGSSAAHTQKPDAGGGPDEPQHHSDQEDPDAYDVVYLNRLLDYAGEDGIAMKETAPLVAQSAQAHSPLVTAGDAARGAGGLGSSRAALPPQRPRSSTCHSAHPKPGPAPANEPARAAHAHRSGSEWRPAADVVDEPAAAAALLDTNAGLRGKKLQAMPGAMLRRRPASARQDPLGEKLDVHVHLVANTVCHPLLAKKRAAEKAAAREQAAREAAALAGAQAKHENQLKRPAWRPSTAQARDSLGARAHGHSTQRSVASRPASAMARMTSTASDNLRRTFSQHDSRMAALSQHMVGPAVDMRDKVFLSTLEGETPSKQRRASTGPSRVLGGILDSSSAHPAPTTDFEGKQPADTVRLGAEVHAREYACTVMPPKLPPASSEEISRTMDGRLQAMLGWAERATDPAAADAKLTDWFGKWLKSYELEQNAFKSAQVYGEVKMNETLNSCSLDRLANPNRFRTAVVCDMFGRIMPIFGRYRGLMQQIRQELMTAIYSDFMEDVNVFEMVPFFSNKATLSLEVSDLKRERARLMNELGDQEERVIALQRKVREFREEVQSVKLEAAWSRSKQSQMEVSMLSQHFGGDNREELISQNKKLRADLHTEGLLRQASQDRIRELENDVDMLRIRVQTAEQEWKVSMKSLEHLRQELSMAEARLSKGSGVPTTDMSKIDKISVVDWANKILGAPKGKPFFKDLDTDLADCRVYHQLIGIIWDNDEVRRNIAVVKTKIKSAEVASDTAVLMNSLLGHELIDGEQLMSAKSLVHHQMLVELMCSYDEIERAKNTVDKTLSAETLALAMTRRTTIAETIRASFELENKCAEQARALNELVGEEVEDEELENHASMKLTAEGLQNIFSQVDDTGAETDCAELARKCIEQMLQDAKALHGCFHFYCKLAERGAQDADVNSKHATYLSSMETMDLDELKALIVGAKLQLPKLEEAYTKAYSQTVSKIQDESEHELGMGFVHFQECLIRLAIQLSPQWARGASDNLSFVPEVLSTINQHIVRNCERLQHEEFGLLVRADGMQETWKKNERELREGFKLFCTSENNTTMSLHDFMRFLKETKIAGARLSAPAIVDIFSCVQEEGSNESSSDTMDFQEFLEAIAACAVYMDPSPYMSLCPKVQDFLESTLLPAFEKAKVQGRSGLDKKKSKKKK